MQLLVIGGAKQPLKKSDVYMHRFGDYVPDGGIIIEADKTNEKKGNRYKGVRFLASVIKNTGMNQNVQ